MAHKLRFLISRYIYLLSVFLDPYATCHILMSVVAETPLMLGQYCPFQSWSYYKHRVDDTWLRLVRDPGAFGRLRPSDFMRTRISGVPNSQ